MIYEINNLVFSYSKDTKLLNGVNLSIKEGELITILGKNGSGKSTLFSLMMGLNKNYDGSILINGKDLKDTSEKEIANSVGFVFQNHIPSFGYTVFEFVLLGLASKTKLFSSPSAKDKEYADKILKELELNHLRDKDYSELSGGELQQVNIARALVSKPKMIIFDEPTAHLDYSNTIKVLKLIKKLNNNGYTIAFSTHDPNHPLMLNCKVALLDNNGTIEIGNCDEMVTEEKMKMIYGEDVKIRYNKEFKRNICVLTI